MMTHSPSDSRLTISRLILIPAAITLAVTLLRLIGELQHWSPTLFNSEAGGPGSLIGITWLAPIFGIYFALKLSKSGAGPERIGRAILFGLLESSRLCWWALLPTEFFTPGITDS